jgi:hypothetical protein
MLDARLAGYWSDKDLYLGGMEGTDIAFGADGTGWTYWSNAAGAFEILCFTWEAHGAALAIHVDEYASGTWTLDGGRVTHHQRDRREEDEHISVGYQITAGQTAVGAPATVLRFDQHVIRGVASNLFALERELTPGERGPPGNTWYRRYETEGPAGRRDRSKRPAHCPHGTSSEVVGKIIYLRTNHHFGPEKISMYLKRYHDVQISNSGCGGSSSGWT